MIGTNVWLGVPFMMVALLGGLQAIDTELMDAAAVDGANAWQRFWKVVMPQLRGVNTVVFAVTVIDSLRTFDIVWAMTRGGPVNATHLMATLSYQRAILGSQLGEGAAISTSMIPFLLVAILIS